MTRYIYWALAAIIIITLNVLYGSVISWFLSITFLISIFYFITQLGLENIVNTQLQKVAANDTSGKGYRLYQFGKKWESVIKFICISVVFISAVICVQLTMHPNGKQPWFLNNEYHGLSHKGITFDKSLTVYKNENDSVYQNASITFSHQNMQSAQVGFNNFYTPVFTYDKKAKKATLINHIIPSPILQSFTLSNHLNVLDIQVNKVTPSFFKRIFSSQKEHIQYKLRLESKDQELLSSFNLNAPFVDEIIVEGDALKKGMLLFDVLLNNDAFKSEKEEAYLILEQVLLQIGKTYLLSSYENEQSQLRLFPGYELWSEGYKVSIDGAPVAFQFNNKSTISFDQDFYIDFNNQKKLLRLTQVNGSEYGLKEGSVATLQFDYPNTYMLRSPGKQKVGNKNIRSITNEYEKIIDDDLKEGFYFTTYGLSLKESIHGTLDFVSGKPNTALAISVTDYNKSSNNKKVDNNRFALSSSNTAHNYLFNIRDFSDNGFSPEKTTLYLGIIYLAFLILTIGFPGKNLERLEPIILSVIIALITLRFIMYWRLATFPPLDNISKYELENTLINFDFQLGFTLPIPLTVIWIMLFTAVIISYRIVSKGENNLLDKYFRKVGTNIKTLNKQYIYFIIGCALLHLLNSRILHIETLTRFTTIIIPLIGYCYFSIRNNKYYVYEPMQLSTKNYPNWIQHLKAYFYYFINNPTAVITLATIVYFGLFDRGFAILFVLFILLKNILINLTKKGNEDGKQSVGKMLYKPYNYWIYGFISLAVYLTILSFKALFYYVLTYKLVVILIVLIAISIAVAIIYAIQSKWFKISLGVTIAWIILISIPATHQWADHKLDNIVKHVIYRASIINQPISSLLQENEYASFKTRKIIETAENQWFINSYISKEFNNEETINLRAHSKIGVDYPTQTRDVVIARYVISEMGNFVMYLILLLILLPMVLYMISYNLQISPKGLERRTVGSYAGLIPLLLLFTIALFVWLTSTNRFVFFGQDFPFLSLTSKISVLLPLLLLGITLIYKPVPKHSFHVDVRKNSLKYIVFIALIAVFALTTVKQNELSNENFSVVMDTTKDYIDNNLNAILNDIQDSLSANNEPINYQKIITILKKNKDFDSLVNDVVHDKYTASILHNLVNKPAMAFQLNNPLFMIFDNGRYTAMYNKNLFLELPPVENRNLWQGSVIESLVSANATQSVISINDNKQTVSLPYYKNDPLQHMQFALLPSNWFTHTHENVGLLNILNPVNSKQKTTVFIYKNIEKNMEQNGTSFVATLRNDDFATLYSGKQTLRLGFKSDGNRFALNKWINGTYRIIYPLKANNFWIYNFAHAIRNSNSNLSSLNNNVYITLDYELGKKVQQRIYEASQNKSYTNNRRYSFSVIGADGDGKVRFMSDYVANRQNIDPNEEATIFEMQQKQFFFSNARNERDQWGNRNLLNMYLGPGSSIKPLIAGVVSSQINAGWASLVSINGPSEIQNYAGLKLLKPWKNTDFLSQYSLSSYIESSSNFYESIMLFLGSYPKDAFMQNNEASLANILSKQAGSNNTFPVLQFNGSTYYLPNYNGRKGNWPATDQTEDRKSFFGNNNSIMANGLELNANLRTTDKDKNDASALSADRVNFVDSLLYNKLIGSKSSSYLWSFPEESFFLQSERVHKEIYQNFNTGLKTATLGGYPMKITPFKMNEMYLSLMSQNPMLRLSIIHQNKPKSKWNIDATWKNNSQYNQFLAENIFKGMRDVIFGGSGTLRNMSYLKSAYPQYHFYAKTGTINEENSGNKSSKRLILIISDKDLTNPNNIGNTKLYALYFTSDQTHSFDFELLKSIVDYTIQSKSFKHYFK